LYKKLYQSKTAKNGTTTKLTKLMILNQMTIKRKQNLTLLNQALYPQTQTKLRNKTIEKLLQLAKKAKYTR